VFVVEDGDMLSWRVLGVECYLNRHDADIYDNFQAINEQ